MNRFAGYGGRVWCCAVVIAVVAKKFSFTHETSVTIVGRVSRNPNFADVFQFRRSFFCKKQIAAINPTHNTMIPY
eukprot:scaffold6986_cov190-Amphora_coffeaeformis.AAC.4